MSRTTAAAKGSHISAEDIGGFVRQCRVRAKMPQKTVALEIGVTDGYYSRVEAGDAVLSIDKAKLIEQFFELRNSEVVSLVLLYQIQSAVKSVLRDAQAKGISASVRIQVIHHDVQSQEYEPVILVGQ